MDPIPLTLILSLFFFFIITISSDPCKPDSCNSILGPQVEFPFRLKRQPARCGYPGFDLYCNSQNQTILNLPFSGKFIVDHINYKSKSLFINFTFSRRPPQFPSAYTTTFTFLNCSSDYKHYHSTPNMSLFCLSRRNYTVLAMSPRSSPVPPTCRRIESVLVPLQWTLSEFYWSAMDLQDDLEQVWSCLSCENEGGLCGYKGDSGPEVGCIGLRPSKGPPKSAKYGIIIGIGIGIGIWGLVCIIGLAFYACGKVSGFNLRPITVLEERPTIRSTSGLDRPIIESYPTTVLGQSRRLPDATCPICLSNYQPNETLRSIPECNHYFHADCIDEWLKLSASCPLCRNSRESSIATPCFSSSPSTI